MSSRIRLIIQQPSLAKYRVPVFRELAKCPDIQLKLFYGSRRNVPNVAAEGFDAEPVHLWHKKIRGQNIFWHSAQWSSASRRQADVLLLTWNPRYLSLIPTLLRAKFAGVPTILWGHGYSKNESLVRRKSRHAVARLATALLFYNKWAAEEFLEAGWSREAVFVASNCLDQTPIRAACAHWLQRPEELQLFHVKHRLNPAATILFVSRLDAANRLDLLIEAVAKLAPEIEDLQVVVIGKGEAEERRLSELAHQLGIDNRVRFLGAIYDELELAPWFLSARVFCYPSNIGLSLMHAFGYGLPVVTGDDVTCQNPEIIALRHEENGLLFSHGDATALAEAIRRVVCDSQFAAKLSQEASRTVAEEFTLENMVGQMAAAVRYCAAKRHGTS